MIYDGTPESLVKFMSESSDVSDWNRRIDEVKLTHDGDYPSFWFATILLSGVADKTATRWNGDAKSHIGRS